MTAAAGAAAGGGGYMAGSAKIAAMFDLVGFAQSSRQLIGSALNYGTEAAKAFGRGFKSVDDEGKKVATDLSRAWQRSLTEMERMSANSGKAIASNFLGGIDAVRSGNPAKSFQAATQGMSDMIQMSGQAAVALTNIAGQFDKLGPIAEAAGTAITVATEAMSMFTETGGQYLGTIAEIGDTYLELRRTLAASTVDLEQVNAQMALTQEIMGSGAVDHFDDVANSIARFQRGLGLTGPALRDFTETYAAMAELVGSISPTNIAGVLNAYKASDMKAASDGVYDYSEQLTRFTNIIRATGGNAESMVDSMIRVGPAMRALGYDSGGTALFFGQLLEKGLRGQKLVYGMNQIVEKMHEKVASGKFDSLESAFSSLIVSVKRLQAAGKEQTAISLLSDYTTPANAALLNEAIKEGVIADAKELGKRAREGFNQSLSEAASETSSLADIFENVQQQFEAAISPIGLAFDSFIISGGNKLVTWLSENQVTVAKWAKNVADMFLDGFGGLIKGFGAMVSGFASWINPVIDIITVAIQGTVWPFKLLFQSLGLLSNVPGLGKFFKGFDAVGDALGGVIDGLTKVRQMDISAPVEKFGDALVNLSNKLPQVKAAMAGAIDTYANNTTVEEKFKVLTKRDKNGVPVLKDGKEQIVEAYGEIDRYKRDPKTGRAIIGADGQYETFTAFNPMMKLMGDQATWEKVKAGLKQLSIDITYDASTGIITNVNALTEEAKKIWQDWYSSKTKASQDVAVKPTHDGSEISSVADALEGGTVEVEVKPSKAAIEAWAAANPLPGPGAVPQVPSTAYPTPSRYAVGPTAGPYSGAPGAPIPQVTMGVPGAPVGGVIPEVNWGANLAKSFQLSLTSSLRPGDSGFHGQGHAGDYSNTGQFAPPTKQMLDFANYVADNLAQYVDELIFETTDVNGNQIFEPFTKTIGNGQFQGAMGLGGRETGYYNREQAQYHGDHVHIAWKQGALAAMQAAGIQIPQMPGAAGVPAPNAPVPPVNLPQIPMPSIPPANPARWTPEKTQIAAYIVKKAQASGYTPMEAVAFVAQALGESSLDPNAYGANTGDATGGASGIFQFTPGTWNQYGKGSVMDAQANIDAYFNLAKERDPRTGDIRSRIAAVSKGGPAVPNNGDNSLNWPTYMEQAADLIKSLPNLAPVGTGPAPGPVAQPLPKVDANGVAIFGALPPAIPAGAKKSNDWQTAENGWKWWQDTNGATLWCAPDAPVIPVPEKGLQNTSEGYWANDFVNGKAIAIWRPMPNAPKSNGPTNAPAAPVPAAPAVPASPIDHGPGKTGTEPPKAAPAAPPAPKTPPPLVNPYMPAKDVNQGKFLPGGHGAFGSGIKPGASAPTGDLLPGPPDTRQGQKVPLFGDLMTGLRAVQNWFLYGNQQNNPEFRAAGGPVFGAGTATSDSIPAMLSNGEFVQRADAVNHYGLDFMHALNQKRLPRMGFDKGGEVNYEEWKNAAADLTKSFGTGPHVAGTMAPSTSAPAPLPDLGNTPNVTRNKFEENRLAFQNGLFDQAEVIAKGTAEMVTHPWDALKGLSTLVLPQFTDEGQDAQRQAWSALFKDLTQWDQWGDDPAGAAGGVAMNLATLFLPGGGLTKSAKGAAAARAEATAHALTAANMEKAMALNAKALAGETGAISPKLMQLLMAGGMSAAAIAAIAQKDPAGAAAMAAFVPGLGKMFGAGAEIRTPSGVVLPRGVSADKFISATGDPVVLSHPNAATLLNQLMEPKALGLDAKAVGEMSGYVGGSSSLNDMHRSIGKGILGGQMPDISGMSKNNMERATILERASQKSRLPFDLAVNRFVPAREMFGYDNTIEVAPGRHFADPDKVIGKTFYDPGFLSAGAGHGVFDYAGSYALTENGSGAAQGRSILVYVMPEGSRALWVGRPEIAGGFMDEFEIVGGTGGRVTPFKVEPVDFDNPTRGQFIYALYEQSAGDFFAPVRDEMEARAGMSSSKSFPAAAPKPKKSAVTGGSGYTKPSEDPAKYLGFKMAQIFNDESNYLDGLPYQTGWEQYRTPAEQSNILKQYLLSSSDGPYTKLDIEDVITILDDYAANGLDSYGNLPGASALPGQWEMGILAGSKMEKTIEEVAAYVGMPVNEVVDFYKTTTQGKEALAFGVDPLQKGFTLFEGEIDSILRHFSLAGDGGDISGLKAGLAAAGDATAGKEVLGPPIYDEAAWADLVKSEITPYFSGFDLSKLKYEDGRPFGVKPGADSIEYVLYNQMVLNSPTPSAPGWKGNPEWLKYKELLERFRAVKAQAGEIDQASAAKVAAKYGNAALPKAKKAKPAGMTKADLDELPDLEQWAVDPIQTWVGKLQEAIPSITVDDVEAMGGLEEAFKFYTEDNGMFSTEQISAVNKVWDQWEGAQYYRDQYTENLDSLKEALAKYGMDYDTSKWSDVVRFKVTQGFTLNKYEEELFQDAIKQALESRYVSGKPNWKEKVAQGPGMKNLPTAQELALEYGVPTSEILRLIYGGAKDKYGEVPSNFFVTEYSKITNSQATKIDEYYKSQTKGVYAPGSPAQAVLNAVVDDIVAAYPTAPGTMLLGKDLQYVENWLADSVKGWSEIAATASSGDISHGYAAGLKEVFDNYFEPVGTELEGGLLNNPQLAPEPISYAPGSMAQAALDEVFDEVQTVYPGIPNSLKSSNLDQMQKWLRDTVNNWKLIAKGSLSTTQSAVWADQLGKLYEEYFGEVDLDNLPDKGTPTLEVPPAPNKPPMPKYIFDAISEMSQVYPPTPANQLLQMSPAAVKDWMRSLVDSYRENGGVGGQQMADVYQKFFGNAEGKAAGGEIWGAGTATSDSIPAWLSNGEFVHNAAAVDYYGKDFMHALNQRKIKLAGGGDPNMPYFQPSGQPASERGMVGGKYGIPNDLLILGDASLGSGPQGKYQSPDPAFNPWINFPMGRYEDVLAYLKEYVQWQEKLFELRDRKPGELEAQLEREKSALDATTEAAVAADEKLRLLEKQRQDLLAVNANTDLTDLDKKITEARAEVETRKRARIDANRAWNAANRAVTENNEAIELAEAQGPPTMKKKKDSAKGDKDAESLGLGLVQGIFEALGFPDPFIKPITEWGIWKKGMGLLGQGIQLGQLAGVIPGGENENRNVNSGFGPGTVPGIASGIGQAIAGNAIPGVASAVTAPGANVPNVAPAASVTPAMTAANPADQQAAAGAGFNGPAGPNNMFQVNVNGPVVDTNTLTPVLSSVINTVAAPAMAAAHP